MYRGRSKVLPVVLVILVTIVAIFALVSVGRALLNRGDNAAESEESPAEQSLLVSEIDRSVRMTIRGPIVADENFNYYQITVGPAIRTITTYEGYQDRVLETKQFANSTAAYEEFVYALSELNYTDSVQAGEVVDDVRGVCATGRLYHFDILQAQSVIRSSWIASCRGSEGTFKGDAVATRDLFLRQIPDGNELLRDLNL